MIDKNDPRLTAFVLGELAEQEAQTVRGHAEQTHKGRNGVGRFLRQAEFSRFLIITMIKFDEFEKYMTVDKQ